MSSWTAITSQPHSRQGLNPEPVPEWKGFGLQRNKPILVQEPTPTPGNGTTTPRDVDAGMEMVTMDTGGFLSGLEDVENVAFLSIQQQMPMDLRGWENITTAVIIFVLKSPYLSNCMSLLGK